MEAEARFGLVHLHLATEVRSRSDAARLLVEIANAIVNSGDICDPRSQKLQQATALAVEEFLRTDEEQNEQL